MKIGIALLEKGSMTLGERATSTLSARKSTLRKVGRRWFHVLVGEVLITDNKVTHHQLMREPKIVRS